MFGKSAGAGRLVLGAIALVTACAHNVPQDSASGADSRPKGAKPINLENGEGKAKGIVTYPGGDRVDWKLIELPQNIRGQIDVKLQWQPPRPGLQLAFDVFDEYNTPIVQSKRTSRKRSTSRIRTATIDNAKGKYFIRVYAVGRGDAGAYKLTVDFKENTGPIALDLSKVDIPEPPKLAAVPEIEIGCDEFTFDVKVPACKNICPTSNAPPGWPACKGKCPDPPDVNNSACWNTMPCPNPPDRRVKSCPKAKWPKCLDINNPDPQNPNCDDATAPPVTARVIKTEIQQNDTIITIAAGSDQGVSKAWKGHVLRADTDTPMDGGDVTVIRVGKRETIGKAHLTTDQISANPRVKLIPPPK
ncbi:MAG: hypothetical protein ABJE66_16635 [Deltaproteobacteria bacterium]